MRNLSCKIFFICFIAITSLADDFSDRRLTLPNVVESCTKERGQREGYWIAGSNKKLFPNQTLCSFGMIANQSDLVRFPLFEAQFQMLKDILIMFNGPDCLASRANVYTGVGLPYYLSTKNVFSVLYIGTSSGNAAGFVGLMRPVPNNTTRPPPELYDNVKSDLLAPCGGNLKSENGQLEIRSYLKPAQKNILCVWRLTSKTGHIYFENITLDNKNVRGLWILKGFDCAAPVTFHKNSHIAKDVSSISVDANVATIVFFGTGGLTNDSFYANYSQVRSAFDTLPKQPKPMVDQKGSGTMNTVPKPPAIPGPQGSGTMNTVPKQPAISGPQGGTQNNPKSPPPSKPGNVENKATPKNELETAKDYLEKTGVSQDKFVDAFKRGLFRTGGSAKVLPLIIWPLFALSNYVNGLL